MIDLIVREHEKRATYDVYLGAERLCRSRTPLLTAARVLLARGIDGETRLGMWREGRSAPDMTATVGGAAALAISEDPVGGLRFRQFKEFSGPPQQAKVA
jgi:hypothetical protein